MATPEQEDVVGEEPEESPEVEYKVPEKKTIDEILQADQEDESLRKYKETLLGTTQIEDLVLYPGKPRVVMDRMTILLDNGTEVGTINLQGSKEEMKKTFSLTEKALFKMRLDFYVQGKEIVTGLKYKQCSYKTLIPVDTSSQMLGSYSPRKEMFSYTVSDEAPHGTLARGKYKVKSSVVDDDKNEYLKWEWSLEIKSAK